MTDLQAYEIQLVNQTGYLPARAVRSESLRGLFYKHTDRKLADILHTYGQKGSEQQAAPYAISLLTREISQDNKKENIVTGLRISSFQAELGNRIVEIWGALAARQESITLGNANLVVTGIKPDKFGNHNFEQLWDQSQPAHGLKIKFATPTLLKRNNHHDRLPTPRMLWGYYLRRWEQYSRVDLPPSLQLWIEKCAYTRSLDLKTSSIPYEGDKTLDGFTGDIEYHIILGKKDEFPQSRIDDYLRSWQTLGMFAEFCGTGENTTEGFGRTVFIRSFGLRSE